MTPTITRSSVRAMLESHVYRHAQACLDGRGNAVKLDIDDELNDAYAFIYERSGALAAEQFKRMYVEEELAVMLDFQANPQAMRWRILPNRPHHRVVMRSQLPPQKRSNGGFLVVLTVMFFLGMLVAFS